MAFTKTLISLILLSLLSTACSPVATSGKGPEDNGQQGNPNPPGPGPGPGANGSEELSYFRMYSNEAGGVQRSSTLKYSGGVCQLENFYDFPDEIFGDSSLDNITYTQLDKKACRRLAIAADLALNNGGSCTSASVALSNSEVIESFQSAAMSGPAALFGGLPSNPFADPALSGAGYSLVLSSDCVCYMNIEVASLFGGSPNNLRLPTDLGLCSQKFSIYGQATLNPVLNNLKAKHGID